MNPYALLHPCIPSFLDLTGYHAELQQHMSHLHLLYTKQEREFTGKRVKMSNETNLSHGNPPNLKTLTAMRDRVILAAMKYEDNFGDVEEAYTYKTILLTTTRLVRYIASQEDRS